MCPKGQPIDIVFLDDHDFKLPSQYLCLYAGICVISNFGQRSLQIVNAEIHYCLSHHEEVIVSSQS